MEVAEQQNQIICLYCYDGICRDFASLCGPLTLHIFKTHCKALNPRGDAGV